VKEEESTIGPQSRVTVALLGGIFLAIVGAVWSASRWAAGVDNRLANIEGDIGSALGDRWTERDMAMWVERLRELNPELKAPSVRR